MLFIFMTAAAMTGASAAPGELLVSGDFVQSGSVNGAPARLRIDPAAPAMPAITTALAQRARLRAGPFTAEYQIGPRKVEGQTAVTRIDLGFGPQRRRIWWTARSAVPGVDGVVGPGLLPFDSVRFQLRPAKSGEQTITLPMVGQGGLESAWGERYALVQVGGHPVRIRFEPHRHSSLATASAALRLASEHGGRMAGAPGSMVISFGIERPVRTMVLGRPLVIGPLAITTLGVRTRDFGSASSIAEVGTEDPDEVVVTGRRKRHPAAEQITLGRDQLERCSSIVFDRKKKQIRLTCR